MAGRLVRTLERHAQQLPSPRGRLTAMAASHAAARSAACTRHWLALWPKYQSYVGHSQVGPHATPSVFCLSLRVSALLLSAQWLVRSAEPSKSDLRVVDAAIIVERELHILAQGASVRKGHCHRADRPRGAMKVADPNSAAPGWRRRIRALWGRAWVCANESPVAESALRVDEKPPDIRSAIVSPDCLAARRTPTSESEEHPECCHGQRGPWALPSAHARPVPSSRPSRCPPDPMPRHQSNTSASRRGCQAAIRPPLLPVLARLLSMSAGAAYAPRTAGPTSPCTSGSARRARRNSDAPAPHPCAASRGCASHTTRSRRVGGIRRALARGRIGWTARRCACTVRRFRRSPAHHRSAASALRKRSSSSKARSRCVPRHACEGRNCRSTELGALWLMFAGAHVALALVLPLVRVHPPAGIAHGPLQDWRAA